MTRFPISQFLYLIIVNQVYYVLELLKYSMTEATAVPIFTWLRKVYRNRIVTVVDWNIHKESVYERGLGLG